MTGAANSTSTDEMKTLGDVGAVPFARFGPDTGPCLGECGREVPLAHLGTKTFRAYCSDCEQEAERKRDADERAEIVARLIERAGPPPKMRDWSLETYPQDEWGARARATAEQWLSNYLAGTRRNLVLWGDVGGGKTGLAWAICRVLCEEQIACRMVNFREVLNEMRAAFREGRAIRDDWRAVSVLVVDDLGSERPTDFAREELASLVDYRWSNDLVTIFTSNFRMGRLAARLSPEDPDFIEGKRIVSRIQDGAEIVQIDAPDRRVRSR